MDFLTEFGVKPVLLAAQVVNFLILLFLLKKFLYQKVLDTLEERKKRIADSIKNAADIEKKLIEIEEEKEKKLNLARKEAQVIIDEAKAGAAQIIDQAHQKAEADLEKLSNKYQQQLRMEKEKMMDEVKSQAVSLVIAGLKSVTGKVIDSKSQREMIERSIKGIS